MIIFTQHSLLKLQQRRISKNLVKETLSSPDYTFPSYSNRIIAYRRFDELYLKVVYKREGDDIIVITQHWEEKPKLIK